MDEDFGYEPYENDLEEWGNREAWEDSQADMRELEAEEDEPPELDDPLTYCDEY